MPATYSAAKGSVQTLRYTGGLVLTRRKLLRSLAVTGPATVHGVRLLADMFPAQAVIDADPLRPRYHLMPKRGWMNDPCAPVYYRGYYHMFFQYNPNASIWGDMHWAHAVSTDMVHWVEHPVALSPSPDGPDAYGVFTGSMVLDHGTPTILYTCVSPSTKALATLWGADPPEREQQCLAVPNHSNQGSAAAALDRWDKRAIPVITTPPTDMKVTGFRDPVPWQETDGSYYMLLASGQQHVGGNVLLYKSSDLRHWNFQHIFAEGKWTGKQTNDTVDSGEMWECPDFFELDGKHVLIHSTGTAQGRRTLWQSGTLDRSTMRWSPEHEGVLNHGPYYAPKTQRDAAGRRILWGWIEETRPKEDYARAGWAGCMSLPRTLHLENGALRFAPAREVDTLRGTPTQSATAQADIVLEFSKRPAPQAMNYSAPGFQVVQSSGSTEVQWNGATVVREVEVPDSFTVRCFIDRSLVEVFLGDFAVLTHRVYNGGNALLSLPGSFRLQRVSAYNLKSIS